MLSQRAQSLKPSPTLALAAKANELKAQGLDVISLTVGEPDWPTFEVAAQAGIEAIKKGKTKYTSSDGILELRKLIAAQVGQDTKLNFNEKQVTVASGAKFIIFSALQMLCDPGDEVLIPTPCWVSYATMVELTGAKPIMIECGEKYNYKLTPELLSKHITSKSKAIILNSPSNPTGEVYSYDEWKALAKILSKNKNLFIISDDIYNRLYYGGSEVAPHMLEVAPELKDQTVLVNGVSKTYAMTGWRIGWGVGPENLIKAMTNYASQAVSCAPSLCQEASVAALKSGEAELKKVIVKLKERRDFAFDRINKIPGLKASCPQGAFYFWINVRNYFGKKFEGVEIKDSRDFSAQLLKDQMVVVVPGVEFSLEGFIRISFAVEQNQMDKAFKRIEDFLSKLK